MPVATAAETERQTAVDQAAGVTNAASRISAQSWTLGSIGAQWNALDQVQAGAALSAAVQVSLDKAANAAGYWGQAQAVRESAASWNEATRDLADYNIQRLESAAARAWELRAVAAEWVVVDKAQAADPAGAGA